MKAIRDYYVLPEWTAEAEEWLKFIEQKGQIGIYKPGLLNRKRGDAWAEIQVAYFLDKKLGCKILEWQPDSGNGKKGEFIITDLAKNEIFIEVKRPSWKGEIVEKEGENSERLKKPKHINGEGRWTSPWKDVRECVKRSYGQLRKDLPNILVIVDDLNPSILTWPGTTEPDIALKHQSNIYGNELGLFVVPDYNLLNGVLFLNVSLYGPGPIKYLALYKSNPFAVKPLKENNPFKRMTTGKVQF